MECVLEDAYILAPRKVFLTSVKDLFPALRTCCLCRQAPRHHCRGSRRRSTRDASHQQAPRHLQGGSAVKPPGYGRGCCKAMLQGHRHYARRPGDLRGPGHPARKRPALRSGCAKKIVVDKEDTDSHRGCRQQRPTSRPALTRFARSWKVRAATTTARSLEERIAKLSAAWPKLTLRGDRKRTKVAKACVETPCTRRVPPSKRGFPWISPCSGAATALKLKHATDDTEPATTSSCGLPVPR